MSENKALTLAKKYATERGYEGEVAEAFISAFVENFEKGREEEREKARQEKLESAKKFLAMGLSAEQISQATGLSLNEIKELQK